MKTIMFWLTVGIVIALDLSIIEVMYRNNINILDIVIFVILNAVAFVLIKHAKKEIFNDKPEV